MRIQKKIIISLLGATLVAVGFVGVVSYFSVRSSIQELQTNTLKNTAKIKADAIERFFRNTAIDVQVAQNFFNIKRNLPIVSQFSDKVSDPTYTNAKSVLDDQLIPQKDTLRLVNIVLFDSVGRIVYEAEPIYMGSQEDVSKVLQSSFLKGKDRIYISDIFFDQKISEQPISVITAPINVDGEFLGVVGFIRDIGELYDLIQDTTGLGNTGETLLVERVGDYVAYLSPLRYDADAVSSRKTMIGADEGIPAQEAIQGRSGFGISKDYRGEEVFAVWFPSSSLNWGFVAKIDVKEALAPVILVRNLIIVTFLIIAFLIIIASYLISRSISDPIKRLQEGIKVIGAGNFDYQIKIEGEDEIVQLAKGFNKMASDLKDSRAGLEEKIAVRTKELTQVRDALLNIAEDLRVEKERSDEAKVKDEAILGSIGEGLLVVDQRGMITMANLGAEKLLGYSIKDMLGKSAFDVLIMEDEKGVITLKNETPLHHSIVDGRTVNGTYYYARKDKSKFPVAVTSSPIIFNNVIIGAVDIFRDITKEKEVDKSKTEFVSLASHQLRTPISAIKWYSEMLLDPGKTKIGKLSIKQRRYVNEIYHGNERMIKLINNLLSISRIELGKLVVNLVPVDVKKMTEDIVQEQLPTITKRKQRVSVNSSGDISRIYSDSTLLRVVIENLLSNAIKYTPEKRKIDLIIKKQGPNLLFEVKDNGIGIPKSEQGKVFSKLYRSSNAMVANKEGTGLGLYIVRAVINSLGGEIWFESEKDKGTSFFFTLPTKVPREKS